MREVFINPFTDFGFKKLFGEENSTEFLIDFLNTLLPEEDKIKELTFLKNEHYARTELERKAIFDLFCENEAGEKFIIEVQRGQQKNFIERTIYYSTFPIQEQAEPGREWDFKLKAVYSIGILNFILDMEIFPPTKLLHTIKLMDIETNKVVYDKLSYIYLETPKFKKEHDELETNFDKWLYLLQHLPELEERPKELQERIFERFFEKAKIAKLEPGEVKAYRSSLKIFRDYYNTIHYAEEKAGEAARKEAMKVAQERIDKAEKGRVEEQRKREEEQRKRIESDNKREAAENKILNLAKILHSSGMSIEDISMNTGLAVGELKDLLK